MGGKGSGGARRGTGPKPKSKLEQAVTGDPGHRGRLLTHPSAGHVPVVAEVEEFDAPNVLTVDERLVWMEYAGEAFKKRTLHPSTMGAFIVMCQTILTTRGIALGRDAGTNLHRGWIAEMRKQMGTFDLWPNGKPLYEAEAVAPANPLDRFIKKHG